MANNKNSEFNKPSIQHCKYCNKECHNINSLKQHELRCKQNPNRKEYNRLSQYSVQYRKGKTKETSEEIAKQASILKEMYRNGYVSPLKGKEGTFTGHKHSPETKERIGKSVSLSRLSGYAKGTITPAEGVGRGNYSYIKTSQRTYMLRSTYEFIYALYLLHTHTQFDMENIRVPAIRDNRWSKTFICDFNVGNKIIEVKGIPSGKDYCIRESFESAGYEFQELFHNDIEDIKIQLREYYPIDDLLEKIHKGHLCRNYFVYEFIE